MHINGEQHIGVKNNGWFYIVDIRSLPGEPVWGIHKRLLLHEITTQKSKLHHQVNQCCGKPYIDTLLMQKIVHVAMRHKRMILMASLQPLNCQWSHGVLLVVSLCPATAWSCDDCSSTFRDFISSVKGSSSFCACKASTWAPKLGRAARIYIYIYWIGFGVCVLSWMYICIDIGRWAYGEQLWSDNNPGAWC